MTTPVAFIIFNRPDVTFKVFERIRRAKPTQLFIIADGPRPDRGGVEVQKCTQCRTVKDMVDWECEVHLNFAEKNMGCKNRVYSGISWVFENVDEAIILEDDCLPSLSFFRFCQELLEKYRYDTRVTTIAGMTTIPEDSFDGSYGFWSMPITWGWATWKRSWDLMDINMTYWPEIKKSGYLKRVFPPNSWLNTSNEYTRTYEGKINTWDYQFQFSNIINHALCIVPKVNMVRNIGHGHRDATHTFDPLSKARFVLEENIDFPLIHPNIMIPCEDFTQDIEPQKFDSEIIQDFQEREITFRRLLNAQDYNGVVNYFKETLKKVERLQPSYIYYLSIGCLMKGDYEHAVSFAEDILSWNIISPQAFMIFVQVFFERKHFAEAFTILDKILEKISNVDEPFKKEIINATQLGNENFYAEKYPNISRLIERV